MLTFVNKCDRPGLDPLEILDNIERELGVLPTPLTWPVGSFGDLRGVVDRATGTYHRFERRAGGSTIAPVEHLDDRGGAAREGAEWDRAIHEIELLDATDCVHDPGSYRAGTTTPTLFGSAITNFGVGTLLDALTTLVPAPEPPETVDGSLRSLDAPFAGLVFKIQSNMDPAHRDHVAFVRVATGCFTRGMTLHRSSNGRQLTTKFAHTMLGNERDTVELAYPGDIVGIVSPGGLTIGETLYDGPPARFPPIPAFTPELFARVRSDDVSRHKQLRRGLDQLAAEGVVQLFHDGPQGPLTIAGAVGPLQFEVASFRLDDEFGAPAGFEMMGTHHAAGRRSRRGITTQRSIRCADPRARRRRPARGLRHRVQPHQGAARPPRPLRRRRGHLAGFPLSLVGGRARRQSTARTRARVGVASRAARPPA